MDLSQFTIERTKEGNQKQEQMDYLNNLSSSVRAQNVLATTQSTLSEHEKFLLGKNEIEALQLSHADQYARICLIRFVTGLNNVISINQNAPTAKAKEKVMPFKKWEPED